MRTIEQPNTRINREHDQKPVNSSYSEKPVNANNSTLVGEIKSTLNDLKSAFHNNDTGAFEAQTKLMEEKLTLIK